jgi:bacillolysin
MRLARSAALAAVASLVWGAPVARTAERALRVAVSDARDLAGWDARLARMTDSGELHAFRTQDDPLTPGRAHVRMRQLYRGVPVYGGELVRQVRGGETVSVFGTLYEGIDLDPVPALRPDQALAIAERLSGEVLGPAVETELTVLPLDDGRYALVYPVRVATSADILLYFLDARTGSVAYQRSDLQTQSAVGLGTGVLGDQKKVQAQPTDGAYVTNDLNRPPALRTFDMKGNLSRVNDFLNGRTSLFTADLAHDADNVWTDGPTVDAHTYAGYTYDYYFKRLGRRGLDDNSSRMLGLVHPVLREHIAGYSSDVIGTYYTNAFYAGGGVMVYGEGLPPGRTSGGQAVNYLAGGLDVVAHELTHGVTGFTSRLIYSGESGALNEAFSDIMGTSVEFYFQSPGGGLMQADYLIGEDAFVPGGLRSMSNPTPYGDPDHYSVRYLGTQDNGGVHINSALANQAFYLAIEGGTNRTSGLSVQGVGGANREQIEKVFYRGFTLMLVPSSNYAAARAATLQSARDLYGAGGAVERAVTQAWTAVGVN